ncbi:unnamed protein product, partial [Anisakis simplex]|uniref:VWFA domain-containing protein n=1 Tax=Anisakis simplex TaxID=6269 RepID=A0A0M3JCE4_ANISI
PCLPLPTTTTTTTTTTPITASGAKSARGCACDYRQTWLDLVFVLDSSSEMNRYDFYAVRNFAASFIKAIPVSQETTGRTSRVGIINVAKEVRLS